jgi:hypothetical protein
LVVAFDDDDGTAMLNDDTTAMVTEMEDATTVENDFSMVAGVGVVADEIVVRVCMFVCLAGVDVDTCLAQIPMTHDNKVMVWAEDALVGVVVLGTNARVWCVGVVVVVALVAVCCASRRSCIH